VLVQRAGEVIPQVGPILAKRPKDAQPYQLPTTCRLWVARHRPEGEAMARCARFANAWRNGSSC
jgi:NAD-dependent DNA ligase